MTRRRAKGWSPYSFQTTSFVFLERPQLVGTLQLEGEARLLDLEGGRPDVAGSAAPGERHAATFEGGFEIIEEKASRILFRGLTTLPGVFECEIGEGNLDVLGKF